MRGTQPKLSLCMIARDEEVFLPRCLESVQGVVDEIILVDTGSRDATPEIARAYGARIVSFPWSGSFGEARNQGMNEAKGDWILVMDPDESLHPEDRSVLKEAIVAADDGTEGLIVKVINFFGKQAGDDFVVDPVCRVFRNRPAYRYRERIHEEIGRAILARRPEAILAFTGVRILHYGYLNHVLEGKRKGERNRLILERVVREQPEDSSVLYCYGAELFQAGLYEESLHYLNRAKATCLTKDGFVSDMVVKIALCYREMGRLEEAAEALEQGIQEYPDFPDLYFLQGQVFHTIGDLDRAAAVFRQAAGIGPAPVRYTGINGAGTFRAWHGLGKVYESAYMYHQAIRVYEQALADNSNYHIALLDLLRLLRDELTPEGIRDYVTNRFNCSSTMALLTLCELMVSAGLPRLAYERLAVVYPQEADGDRYHHVFGCACAAAGRPSEAVAAFSHIGPSSPYYQQTLLRLVPCLWALWEWEHAAGILCTDFPEDRSGLYRAFQAHHATWTIEATPELFDALRMAPVRVVLELVDALLSLSLVEAAWEVAVLLRDAPTWTQSLENEVELAGLFEQHGYTLEAERLLEAVLRRRGYQAPLCRLRAEWLMRAGRWQEAHELLHKAREIDPRDLRNHLLLARFWERLVRRQNLAVRLAADLRDRLPGQSFRQPP